MSKTHDKPALSADQQAAIRAIRERAQTDRPGPDELIDRGELDELVPQAQYIEIRALGIRLRELRERMGLSLTDLSERTGLTRAAISRLENGWNLNPTLETLFRYVEPFGASLKLVVNEPGKDH
jgi:DNA-binding XRE family transcriptional regulator